MDTIFEGVWINHGTSNFYPTKPATAPKGTEFRSILKYGSAGYKTYQKEFQEQADAIIKGVFQNFGKITKRYRAANPRNWRTEQNVVVGGWTTNIPTATRERQEVIKVNVFTPLWPSTVSE